MDAHRQQPHAQPYQEFLRRLLAAPSELEARHGRDWLAVLLMDKLDLAQSAGDEVLHNLRNLLQLADLRRHFRVVATGGSSMYKLVMDGSPLANIFDNIWLRQLTEGEADDPLKIRVKIVALLSYSANSLCDGTQLSSNEEGVQRVVAPSGNGVLVVYAFRLVWWRGAADSSLDLPFCRSKAISRITPGIGPTLRSVRRCGHRR